MNSKFTLHTLVVLLACSFGMSAQASFSDDFEAYTAGAYVAASNSAWSTWGKKPGSSEDAKVTNVLAKSGTNSVLIESVLATGGPTDLVLPFGGVYKTGRFVYEMSFYIPEGKNGYFNFQGGAAVGGSWSLNANFNEDGSMVFSNGGTLLSTTFNHNEWVKLVVDANLTSNFWRIVVNDECKGAFTNPTNAVSFLDLFPVDASSLFYVDDVSFSYDPMALGVDNDLSVSNVSWVEGRYAGTEGDLSYILKNNGVNPITSAELSITTPSGTQVIPVSLTLGAGQSKIYTLSDKLVLGSGDNVVSIAIQKVNGVDGDDEECNNLVETNIKGIVPSPYKGVLVEEATGTWCQWCPRGAVFMDLLSGRYEGDFIPVAVHNSDPMEVAEYDALIGSTPGFSGYPSVVINRSSIFDPSGSEAPFLESIVNEPTAVVEAGVSYDATTGDFTVQTTVEYIKDTPLNQYWIEVVLTEDDVRGTTSAYNQSNAYAGGANGVMGGYELLPSSVPAAQMRYDHVGRAIFGLDKTTKFNLASKVGDKRVITFTGNIGPGLKIENFHVIPILMTIKGYDNAAEFSFEEALAKGVTGTSDIIAASDITVYPNPASTEVNFDIDLGSSSNLAISILDISGRLVASKNYGKLSGKQVLPINVQHLNSGVYFANIQTDFGQRIEKIIVE